MSRPLARIRSPRLLLIAFVRRLLAHDLGVFLRPAHAVGLMEGAACSTVRVVLSLGFNGLVLHWAGPRRALEFLTSYLVEKSPSVDNIFVFVLLFSAFRVPEDHQHRVLFWGVLGALVLRGTPIGTGIPPIREFQRTAPRHPPAGDPVPRLHLPGATRGRGAVGAAPGSESAPRITAARRHGAGRR